MNYCDPSKQEVSKEEHYRRLERVVQKAMGTSASISRTVLEFMDDCWLPYFVKFQETPDYFRLECNEPGKGDNLLQMMHCHFKKAPCRKCWRKSFVYNLGLKVAPDEKWKRWINLYQMRKWPRGQCIIICNTAFDGLPEEPEGWLEDVKRMRALFLALHFNCTVATNLKAEEMKSLLEGAASNCDDTTDDCLVVVLISHGKEDYIYGVDYESLHLYDDVYEQFSIDNCPQLEWKPKLFFVQVSREGDNSCCTTAVPKNPNSGCMSADASNASGACQASKTSEHRATWSDMYIAYATIPGYAALRNEESGSWFVSAIREVFLKHAHTDHLAELMRRVHDVIMSRASHDGSRQTPRTEQFGWRKELYFFPGRMYSQTSPKHSWSCGGLRFMRLSKWERIFRGLERKVAREVESRAEAHV